MTQVNATIKPPIITPDEAKELNQLFCTALDDSRLFLFCHYQPIPENPQETVARFVPHILNLFIFACDSLFFLTNSKVRERIVQDEGISDSETKDVLNRAFYSISDSVRTIQLLRACVAHNSSDENSSIVSIRNRTGWVFINNGEITTQRSEYEKWVLSVINKKHPENSIDYDRLCEKLEDIKKNLISNIKVFISCLDGMSEESKSRIISLWEEITIEEYARNARNSTSLYFSQLVLSYQALYAGRCNCTRKDIDAWIERSVGYEVEVRIRNLKKRVLELNRDISICKLKISIKNTDESEKADNALHIIKEGLEENLKEYQNQLGKAEKERERIQKDTEDKNYLDYFFAHLNNQLRETLTTERNCIRSLLPEEFIQMDIRRNFPQLI